MMFSRLLDLLEGRSPKWRSFRNKFLAANPACIACGSAVKLEAHHVLPFHLYPKLELVSSNLVALCESQTRGVNCHLHFGHLGNWKNFNPTVREDAAAWRKKVGT